MIKITNTEIVGWEHAIRGMRNPMNSWEKSDSKVIFYGDPDKHLDELSDGDYDFCIGPNDWKLMMKLAKGGPDDRKFMRMIVVYADITAPLYWWKEFDTYKVGTVANSCSTMHKIHAKEFTLDDFSHEHLFNEGNGEEDQDHYNPWRSEFWAVICFLNRARDRYLETKDKKYWWQMIQSLPSSYNQKRTVMLNYEVLHNMYHARKNHKLDEWKKHDENTCTMDTVKDCLNPKEYLLCEDCSAGKGFCDWIRTLPYSELITGEE